MCLCLELVEVVRAMKALTPVWILVGLVTVARLHLAGEIELAPPTWVTLHELSAWSDVRTALRAIGARTPERFTTRIARGDERIMALWHGDAGYGDGDVDRAGPRHRLCMGPSPWRYERD